MTRRSLSHRVHRDHELPLRRHVRLESVLRCWSPRTRISQLLDLGPRPRPAPRCRRHSRRRPRSPRRRQRFESGRPRFVEKPRRRPDMRRRRTEHRRRRSESRRRFAGRRHRTWTSALGGATESRASITKRTLGDGERRPTSTAIDASSTANERPSAANDPTTVRRSSNPLEIEAAHATKEPNAALRPSTKHRRNTTPPSDVASLRLLENKSLGRPSKRLARPLLPLEGATTLATSRRRATQARLRLRCGAPGATRRRRRDHRHLRHHHRASEGRGRLFHRRLPLRRIRGLRNDSASRARGDRVPSWISVGRPDHFGLRDAPLARVRRRPRHDRSDRERDAALQRAARVRPLAAGRIRAVWYDDRDGLRPRHHQEFRLHQGARLRADAATRADWAERQRRKSTILQVGGADCVAVGGQRLPSATEKKIAQRSARSNILANCLSKGARASRLAAASFATRCGMPRTDCTSTSGMATTLCFSKANHNGIGWTSWRIDQRAAAAIVEPRSADDSRILRDHRRYAARHASD